MPSILSAEQTAAFHRDGYVLIPGFFNEPETALLRTAMEQDPAIAENLYDRRDAQGASTRMVTWNHPTDSVYGMAARSEKMVDTMEALLGGEVYHYHSKLTAKEPREGGAWEWHQDYGYWYHNGCLFPDMASAMIALDPCHKTNGCLQVMKGSHRVGRIEHGLLDGDQVGADLNRIEQLEQHLEIVHCEMQPGDVLFFHCNTLHRSDQNRSDDRRWTILCCYNAASNNPYREHHHPQYTPLEKVADSAIIEAGLKFASPNQLAKFKFLNKPSAPAELQTKVGKTFSAD